MLLVKTIIAHELTHALQDQYIDLETKKRRVPGTEEMHALSAIIEGHATFIERNIGRQLGIRYFKSDKRADYEFKTPLLRHVTSKDSPFALKYSKGVEFIEYHFDKGGNPLLWDILENPPIETSMINYPETYIPKPYDTFNYKAILKDVYDFSSIDSTTKNEMFEYNNFSLSKFNLGFLYKTLNIPDKDQIISKISHYQNLIVTINDVMFAKIGFILLPDELSAQQYFELEQKHVIQKVGDPFLDRYNNILCNNASIKTAKEITTHEKLKTWYDQEKLIKRKYAIFVKDNLIVTYNDYFFWLDYCEILKIAEKIFMRYETAKYKN